jgi:hypothetical protein
MTLATLPFYSARLTEVRPPGQTSRSDLNDRPDGAAAQGNDAARPDLCGRRADRIEGIDSLSAHADYSGTLRWRSGSRDDLWDAP